MNSDGEDSSVEMQKVLLVDQPGPAREITRAALDQLGVAVAESGGVAAMQMAAGCDLAVIAIEIGEPDGLALCRKMADDEMLCQIPVMIISGSRDMQVRLESLQAGAVDFLSRPFLTQEFHARIRTHLRLRMLYRNSLAWQDKLRQVEKGKLLREFSLGIGHNFNNLLTSGLGFLGLAQDEVKDPEALASLRHVEFALKRMGTLAKQLLSFTEDIDLPLRPVHLWQILHNALNLFDPVALRFGAVLICDIAAAAEVMVCCEEFSLTRTILHILHNAGEYGRGKGGRIFVKASLIDERRAVVEISDLGGGIPPEIVERIKQPFFTTRQEVGHGLGLSMADGIIRAIGGEMTIQSETGIGTTVRIELPLTGEQADMVVPIDGVLLDDLSVLIAVDADETRDALEAILLAKKYHPHSVETLGQLEETIEETGRKNDLIIVDLLRSEVFGDELVERIRSFTDLPLLYLASTRHEAPAGNAGLVVLDKPFVAAELLEAMSRFPQLVRYS